MDEKECWHISSADLSDAEEILALQRLAFQTEAERYGDGAIPPLTETLAELRAKWGRVLVLKATAGGRIVGSIQAHQEGEVCRVNRLMVHPDCRRRGLGRALLEAAEARFPAAARYQLETGSRSEGNLRLYRGLGYRDCGRMRLSEKVVMVRLEKNRGGAKEERG